MTTTPTATPPPETDPTSDHRPTPETKTSTPAEDPLPATNAKIQRAIRPMHHDPREIHFSVAGAPSQWILLAIGGHVPRPPSSAVETTGGAWC